MAGYKYRGIGLSTKQARSIWNNGERVGMEPPKGTVGRSAEFSARIYKGHIYNCARTRESMEIVVWQHSATET